MTADTIAVYARAILAHLDAHEALRVDDAGLASAAYAIREQALDEIEEITGRLRSSAFASVALMARDVHDRQSGMA